MNKRVFIYFLAIAFSGFSQPTNPSKIGDSLHKDPFLNTVEQSLNAFYLEYEAAENVDSIRQALDYLPTDLPVYSDDVHCKRLDEMNEISPFHLDCNPSTLSTIKYFLQKKTRFY
jgi:hypothetical protein